MSGPNVQRGGGISSISLASQVTGNLSVTNLNSGTGASGTTFWRGDGTWAVPAGSGTADTSWLGTYRDRGIVKAGLATGASSVIYDPFANIITLGWTTPPTARTNLIGGVVQMPAISATARTPNSLLRSTSKWYMAIRFAYTGATGASMRFLVGTDDAANNFIMGPVDGNGSTTKYVWRIADVTDLEYIVSTVSINTAWHTAEVAYDGTKIYFAIDQETWVELTPTRLASNIFERGRMNCDTGNEANCLLDDYLVLAGSN